MSVKCILQGQKQEVPEVTLESLGAASATDLTSHVSDKNNPHGVTTAQIGAMPRAGGAFTGVVSGVSPTSGSTGGFRNIYFGSSAPASTTGANGDVFILME